MPTRRRVLRTLAGAGAALGAPSLNQGRYRLCADAGRRHSARALEVVRRTTVIDMLSPLTLDFDKFGRFMADPDLFTSADLAPEHFRLLDDVNAFHGLGQRVAQLTYNARNRIGNGATERRDEGLSDFDVGISGRPRAKTSERASSGRRGRRAGA
jgi:hypothetical protein